jgi:Ca2+-binding RTX toxin-like protein
MASQTCRSTCRASPSRCLPGSDIHTEIQGDKSGQPAVDQTITGTSGNDRIMGKGGNDTLRGGDGDDQLYGADKPTGSAAGEIGNDTLEGGAGNDALIGGGGTDTAIYNGELSVGNFSTIADADPNSAGIPGWEINANGFGEGTDTLTGVQIVEGTDPVGAATGRFLLVGNGGFASIQDAVDAAMDGDTILIAEGAYAENLSVTKALSFVGIGAVSIDPASGTAVTLTGDLGGGNVSIDNIDLVGGTNGIFVETSANAGKLTIVNSEISGNSQHGIYLVGDDPDNDGDAPIVAGITSLEVVDTDFSNNGFQNNFQGAAHVKLFGYEGNALFQGVTFEGATPATAQNDRPDNAVEITGYVNNGSGNPATPFTAPNIGTVVFDDVTVTGAYHKNPIAIFNFSEIDGLSVPDLDLSGAVSNWGPLFNIDGVTDLQINVSGFTITLPAGSDIHTEIQGDKSGQPAVDQTITGTSGNDRIMGKGGNDTLRGGDGDDQLYGADKPTGSAAGEIGNDTLEGGIGDDALIGGGGTDTAIYNGELSVGNFSTIADADPNSAGIPGWEINANGFGEGTDTLTGVQIVEGTDPVGAATGRFLLVGNGGFASIQDAVDAAVDGDTILIAAGTYAENVVVDEAITLIGMGGATSVIIDPASGTGLTVSGNIGSGTVTIDGIGFQGGTNGVSASGAVTLGHLEILNSSFSGNSQHGVFVNGKSDGIGKVTVSGSSFTDNGDGSSNGDGDIVLFEYRGDATIQNVTINNATGTADTAIQIAGFEQTTYDVNDPIGTVVIDTVEVNGAFAKVGVYIQGYTNLSGLSLSGVTGTVAAGWGYGTYINPTIDNLAGFNTTGANGTVDLSGVTLVNTTAVNVSNPAHPLFAYNGVVLSAIVNGTPVAETITGTEGNDLLAGGGGNDVINGGEGADILIGGAGNDELHGGSETDTAVFTGSVEDYSFERYPTFTLVIDTRPNGDGQTKVFTDVEKLSFAEGTFTLVRGSNAVNTLVGNNGERSILIGFQNSDTLTGGDQDDVLIGDDSVSSTWNAGNDTLDGGAGNDLLLGSGGDDTLIGGTGNDTLKGAAGDDTFTWSTGDGNDIVDGGSHTVADTLDITNTGGATAFEVNVAAVGPNIVPVTGTDATDILISAGTETIRADEIEDIVFNLGSNGDTVTITGDFSTTALDPTTITVNGGTGNDEVNAAGITSGHRVVFNGNDGDDTFTSGAGSDLFDGGDGIDTYVATGAFSDYSIAVAADGTVTITNTVSGAVDTAEANVEFLNIGGTLIDLTMPVHVYDASDSLVGTFATLQLAHDDAVTVPGFRINLFGTVTGQSLTISKDNLKIEGGIDDTGNVFTLGGGVTTLTLLGDAPFEVIGNNAANVITGNDGANIILGNGGTDVLDGGEGSDTYQVSGTGHGYDIYDDNGSASDTDTIVALSDNTRIGISGHFGSDNGIEAITGDNNNGVYISGDNSDNTLDFSGVSLTDIAFIDGGNGADTITGTGVEDTIRGGGGNDILRGGADDDTYQVSGGGHGYDTYEDSAGGNDTIVALSDNTRIGLAGEFIGSVAGIETITANGNNGVSIRGDNTGSTLDFSSMTLTGIDYIDGQNGDDTIIGTSGDDTIRGSAGNDILRGGAGDDTYQVSGGGHGYDTYEDSAGGSDTIVALSDNTRISLAGEFVGSDAGIETITANGNNGVTIRGDNSGSKLDFSGMTLTGIDYIDGQNGDDEITGSFGADVIRGSAGNDTMDGGDGSDTYQVSGGGHGYDIFSDTGSVSDTDTIVALSDNTRIGISGDFGSANGIEAISGNGNSGVSIRGDNSGNVLDFSAVTLTDIAYIDGQGGNDTITGTSAGEEIRGGSGNDTINGGDGDDVIRGDAGNDILDGGEGSDTYQFAANDGIDTITDTGSASDTDTILATNTNTRINVSGDFSQELTGIEVIDANGGANVRVLGTNAVNDLDFRDVQLINGVIVDASGGNDVVTTSQTTSDHVVYRGGNGTDTLRIALTLAQAADSSLISQIDALVAGSGVNGTVNAAGLDFSAEGFETIIKGITIGDSFLPFDKVLVGTNSTETLTVPSTTEAYLVLARGGNDTVNGSDGNDIIVGDSGNDALNGGGGNDTFIVGSGDGLDTFDGGSGDDQILAGADNVSIGVNGFATGAVELIDANGFAGVRVQDSDSTRTLDFSDTVLTDIVEVDARGGNDTITTSNQTAGVNYRGGTGEDTFNLGSQDTVLHYSGTNQGLDSFNGNTAGATHVAVADTAGTIIGVNGYSNGVDEIQGHASGDTIVRDSNSSRVLDFSDTVLTDIAEVDARGGNDTITTSNQTAGVNYRGGTGEDTFNLGSQDTVLHYSGTDQGLDSFTGNTAGATHVAVADTAGTIIGVNGYSNGVDEIQGHASGDTIVRDSNSSRPLDFSETALTDIAEVDARGGNDTITTSNLTGGVNYRGGTGDDTFNLGSQDTVLHYSGTDQGLDSFNGNTAGATHVAVADTAGTIIGVNGYSNGVDEIQGHASGDTIIGDSNSSRTLDFSATTLTDIAEINARGGNDTVIGSSGNDVIRGGTGTDTLIGGAGDDTFLWSTGDGNDRVDGGSETGADMLDITNTGGSTAFTVNVAAGGSNIVPGTGTDATDILVSDGSATVRADEIEDIDFHLGNAGDSVTISGDFSSTALDTSTIAVQGGTGDDTVDASGITSGHRVVFNGGDGNDTFTSGGGDDEFDGGADVDTLTYGGNFADATISVSGTSLTVSGAHGTDSVTGTEQIKFADTTVLIVDNATVAYDGAYGTIGDALTAAGGIAGHVTILVQAGTYTEDFTVSQGVTILGANAGLHGDDAQNGGSARGNETVIDGTVTINSASKVVLDGFEFLDSQAVGLGNFTSVLVTSSADHEIVNSVFNRDTGNAPLVGWVGAGAAEGHRGVELAATGLGGTVTISNNLFTGANDTYVYGNDTYKSGIYSNGGDGTTVVSNNTFENVRTAVNADDYTNDVQIDGNRFQDLGTGVAIGETAGGNVSGIISGVTNNSFDAVDTDFNFRNLSDGVEFNFEGTGNSVATGDTLLAYGTQGADTYVGSAENDVVIAEGGADTINTGAGNDSVFGGTTSLVDNSNGDTAIYAGNFADFSFGTDVNGFLTVTDGNAGDGLDEGADALINVEILQFGDGTTVRVVGNGGYATIQDAVAAANAGDTILIAAGSYSGNVVVDKQLTFLGANANIAGDGVRGAESALTGMLRFAPGADGSSVNGLQILEGGSALGSTAGVYVQADNIDVSNMLIERSGGFGVARGIVTASGDAQGLEVTGSKITGFATGIYINPGSDATVTGNVLEANNVGLSNDGPDAVNISGNSFVNNVVEQIGIGAANAGANNVGAIVGANSFTGSAPEVSIYDANGTGQTITGTQHDDVIHLGGGGDVIDAGDGDDHIIWTVGDGSDIVDGGVVTNTDTFEAVGTGAAGEEFLIETVAAYETRTSTSGTLDAGTEIVVSRSTDSGATFTAISELRNIDDIFINGSSAAPSAPGFGVTISGDFSATDLDSSTITIVGTSGNDTINVADFTDGDDSDGLQHIVFVSNGGEDTITGARPEDLVDVTGRTVVSNEDLGGGSYKVTFDDGSSITFSNGTPSFVENAGEAGQQPVNLPAAVMADAYSVDEDGVLSVDAASGVLSNDSDIEGDDLTATVATGPAHGSLTLNSDGSFVYTPDADYNGADSFTYTVNDGTSTTAPVTVDLTVDPVNDAPKLVGYFTNSNAAIDAHFEDIISRAGGVGVKLTSLSAADIQGLDGLILDAYYNNSSSRAQFAANRADIMSAVDDGLGIFIFDGSRTWDTFFPGAGITSSVPFGSAEVDIDPSSRFAEGAGGIISNTDLDDGNSSIHGAMNSASLPAGAVPHLTSQNSSQVAGFTLDVGDGSIVYTTMPMTYFVGNYDDYYFEGRYNIDRSGDGFANSPSNGMSNYLVNVVEELIGNGQSNDSDLDIHGGLYKNTLTGGLGDDILNGGLGFDTLTGGDGGDTFVFDADALSDAVNNGIQDLIADYDILEGDVVDLSALLEGQVVTDANEASYVKMDATGTVLEVDIDGAGSDHGFVEIAQFSAAPGAEALKILVDDDTGSTVTI